MAEKKVVKKNLGGRPSKLPLINKEHFEGMCKIQCTKDEMCGIFNVHEETLTKWCHQEYSMGFSDVYKKLSSTGKMSLRRQQFKSAENGNVTMQIWLGKQHQNVLVFYKGNPKNIKANYPELDLSYMEEEEVINNG